MKKYHIYLHVPGLWVLVWPNGQMTGFRNFAECLAEMDCQLAHIALLRQGFDVSSIFAHA